MVSDALFLAVVTGCLAQFQAKSGKNAVFVTAKMAQSTKVTPILAQFLLK